MVAGVSSERLVLVCDDDQLLLDLLEFRLGARGFRVTIAQNGEEALLRIEEELPDAIILDTMMPVIDGNEVLRRIRGDARTAHVPVIMLTARQKERDIVGALTLGADDYLVKPFIPEELIARLTRLLGARAR